MKRFFYFIREIFLQLQYSSSIFYKDFNYQNPMTHHFMTHNALVYHWCCKDNSKGFPSEKTYDSHAARWRLYRFATCPFLKQLALPTADRFRVLVITAQQQGQTWDQVVPFLLKLEELWTKHWRIVVNVGRIVRRYARDTLHMP
jgi:hypothetical protein